MPLIYVIKNLEIFDGDGTKFSDSDQIDAQSAVYAKLDFKTMKELVNELDELRKRCQDRPTIKVDGVSWYDLDESDLDGLIYQSKQRSKLLEKREVYPKLTRRLEKVLYYHGVDLDIETDLLLDLLKVATNVCGSCHDGKSSCVCWNDE